MIARCSKRGGLFIAIITCIHICPSNQRSFQRPGHFTNMNDASLSDTVYFIRGVKAHKPCAVRVLSILSMAIRRNGRKWFVRLHNFNSNSENYINPVDGIKTNLAPTGQSPETREKEIQEERTEYFPKQKEMINGKVNIPSLF